jgi:uridine kinase
MPSLIVGLAGGTGSGKSTLVHNILELLAGKSLIVIEQDNYYRANAHLSFEERRLINYDHPSSLDNELLIEHLGMLRAGQPIEKPLYDFTAHTRRPETVPVAPADIIIVEGILVLENAPLREMMDLKLFVDTDPDVRFIRRLQRDIRDRGRTMESVISQYLTTVRPMHQQFVEPSKRYADVIIPEGGLNEQATQMIAARLRAILADAAA